MADISEISAIFGMEELGLKELPYALFHHCGFGLRFELAYGNYQRGDRIPSFMQALDRAMLVIYDALPETKDVVFAISQYGASRNSPAKRWVSSQLRSLCMDISTLAPAGIVAQEDQYQIAECGEDGYRHWFTLHPATDDEVEKAVWGCIAKELKISPGLKTADIYMLDLKREIIVHIYDDRGMDVIANDLAVLRPIYDEFKKIILEYDREHIDEVFKTGKPHRRFDAKAAFEHRQSAPPEPGIYRITSIRD